MIKCNIPSWETLLIRYKYMEKCSLLAFIFAPLAWSSILHMLTTVTVFKWRQNHYSSAEETLMFLHLLQSKNQAITIATGCPLSALSPLRYLPLLSHSPLNPYWPLCFFFFEHNGSTFAPGPLYLPLPLPRKFLTHITLCFSPSLSSFFFFPNAFS